MTRVHKYLLEFGTLVWFIDLQSLRAKAWLMSGSSELIIWSSGSMAKKLAMAWERVRRVIINANSLGNFQYNHSSWVIFRKIWPEAILKKFGRKNSQDWFSGTEKWKWYSEMKMLLSYIHLEKMRHLSLLWFGRAKALSLLKNSFSTFRCLSKQMSFQCDFYWFCYTFVTSNEQNSIVCSYFRKL